MPMSEIDREKLAEDNINLVYFTIRKYYPTFIGNEEVVQNGMYGLAVACKRFDPDKGVLFSSYAVRCIRSWVLHAIEKEIRRIENETSLDAELNEDFTMYNVLAVEDDGLNLPMVDIESFLDTLNEREKLIVKLQNEGYTQREIAEIFGVTFQRIGQLHRKIKLKWREFNEH